MKGSAQQRPRSYLLGCLLAVVPFTPTHAAGGTGEYPLPWPTAGEVLVYRSCGCGDACWVAEVRDARKRTVKARLRCDCEQLHASVAPGLTEAPQAKRCDAIYAQGDDAGQTDKPAAIARALEQLLGRR